MTTPVFEIQKSGGSYFFQLKDDAEEIIFQSEQYESHEAATKAMDAIRTTACKADVVDLSDQRTHFETDPH